MSPLLGPIRKGPKSGFTQWDMSEGWVAAKIVFCPSRGHVQEIKLPTGANMRK